MIKTTRKNLAIVIGAIAVAFLSLVFFYWPNSSLGTQLRNMKLAGQQAQLLQAKFQG